jgi:hypothetical protein
MVRFAQAHTEVTRTQMSAEEMDAVWYTAAETEAFLQESKLISHGKIKGVVCLRGLELLANNCSESRHQSIVHEILDEQERLLRQEEIGCCAGAVDTMEALGKFAETACAHRQRLAEIRGKQDEMEAADQDSDSAWSSLGKEASPVVMPKKIQQTPERRAARRARRTGRTRVCRTASGC